MYPADQFNFGELGWKTTKVLVHKRIWDFQDWLAVPQLILWGWGGMIYIQSSIQRSLEGPDGVCFRRHLAHLPETHDARCVRPGVCICGYVMCTEHEKFLSAQKSYFSWLSVQHQFAERAPNTQRKWWPHVLKDSVETCTANRDVIMMHLLCGWWWTWECRARVPTHWTLLATIPNTYQCMIKKTD